MEFEKLYELRKDPTEFAIQMGFRTVEIRKGYVETVYQYNVAALEYELYHQ